MRLVSIRSAAPIDLTLLFGCLLFKDRFEEREQASGDEVLDVKVRLVWVSHRQYHWVVEDQGVDFG